MDRPASAKLRSLEDGREVCTIAAGTISFGQQIGGSKGGLVRHQMGVGDALAVLISLR